MMPKYYKMIGLADESPPTKGQTNKAPVDSLKLGQGNNFESPAPAMVPTDPDVPDVPEVVVIIKTNLYTALVSSMGGGTLQSFKLNNYDHWRGGKVDLIDTTLNAGNPVLAVGTGGGLDTLTTAFKLEEGYYDNEVVEVDDSTSLTFHLSGGPDVESITKTLIFYPNSYRIKVGVDVVSSAPADRKSVV